MKKIEEDISQLLIDSQNKSEFFFDKSSGYFYSKEKEIKKVNAIYDFFITESSSDLITSKQEKFYEEIR